MRTLTTQPSNADTTTIAPKPKALRFQASALAALLASVGIPDEQAATAVQAVQAAQEAAGKGQASRSLKAEDVAPKRAVTALARLRGFMLAQAGGATPDEFAAVYGKAAASDATRYTKDTADIGTLMATVEVALKHGQLAANVVSKKGNTRGSQASKVLMETRGVIAKLLDD